jgi:hypothetical protein
VSRKLTNPTSLPSTVSSSGVSVAFCSRRTQPRAFVLTGTFSEHSNPRLPISKIRPSLCTRIPWPSSTSHSS